MRSQPVFRWVMRCTRMVWIAGFALLMSVSAAAAAPINPFAGQETPLNLSSPMPLSFIPNEGQSAQPVQFQANAMGGSLYFTADAVTFLLPGHDSTALKLEFADANSGTLIQGEDRLPGVVNYLVGSNASAWHTHIPTYSAVRYTDLYPGIDLHYNGMDGALKGTYTVAAGADASRIRWRYTGADKLNVDTATGDLQIHLHDGQLMSEKAPSVWQTIGDQTIPVAAGYTLSDDQQISFHLGSYDPTLPLTIDPILLYSTFIGGSASDDAWGIAADNNGFVYVAGRSESSNFPATIGPGLKGQIDAFVVKINTNAVGAASLVWSTYLGGSTAGGGSGGDSGWDIAVDSAGNAYITGTTGSRDFPITPSGFQQQYGPCCTPNAFLTKLSSDGTTVLYSTFLGGRYNEDGYGVAVDSAFNAYITGNTNSDDFPVTASAFESTNPVNVSNGQPHNKLFLTKIDTTASGAASLVYSTYFGSDAPNSGDTSSNGLAVDDAGNAYVTGRTQTGDFPVTANAYQTTIKPDPNGADDAYIARFDTTQSGAASLVYSTYFGGTKPEDFNGSGDIDTDGLGNAYVTGETNSADLPMKNAFQSQYAGNTDVFVAKFDTNASGLQSLLYSSYLGGSDFDQGWGIAATRFGNVYITGQAQSGNFPVLKPIYAGHAGFIGSFVAKMDTTLVGKDSLIYSTFLGGQGNGFGGAAVDSDGTAYVAGQVASTSFPIVNGFQPTLGGGSGDGYMAKLAFRSDLDITKTVSPDPAPILEDMTITLSVKNIGPETATGVIVTEVLPPTVDFVSATPDFGTCNYATQVVTCLPGNILLNDVVTITIIVVPQPSALFAPTGDQFVGLTSDSDLGFSTVDADALFQGGAVSVTGSANAVEKDLNAANSTVTKNVGVFDFTAQTPTLISPADMAHTTTNPITIRWNPVAGATHYVVRFGSAHPPQTTAATVTGTSYTFPSALPIGTSYWSVQGESGGGQFTQPSNANGIIIDSLTNAASIKNFFSTATPTLTWNANSSAIGYQLQVDNQPTFTSPEYSNTNIPANQLSIVTSTLPSGTYSWRVRAILSATTWSAWSAAETIVVNAP